MIAFVVYDMFSVTSIIPSSVDDINLQFFKVCHREHHDVQMLLELNLGTTALICWYSGG
jgi:hypothetical protein